MPHIDTDGKVYTRVTESLSMDCEARAYFARKDAEDLREGKLTTYNSVNTFAALAGTMVHHDIENFLREKEGLPALVLSLDVQSEKLLFKIENTPVLKEEMDRKMANAYLNFIQFWGDYEPIILEIEATLLGRVGELDLKGSADLFCAIRLDKLWEMGRVAEKNQIGDPMSYEMVIVDWKTGTSIFGHHKTQIAAYYLLAQKEIIPRFQEKYPYHTIKSNPRGVDVYLGGVAYKTRIFDLSPSLFLYNVELFLKAKPIPVNHLLGKIGVQLQYCFYCAHRSKCPAYQEGEIELNVVV